MRLPRSWERGQEGMCNRNFEEREGVKKDRLEIVVMTCAGQEVQRQLHRTAGGYTAVRSRLGTAGIAENAHDGVSSILDFTKPSYSN